MAIYASVHAREWGRRSWILFAVFLVMSVVSSALVTRRHVAMQRLREENGRLISKLGTRDYFKEFDDALAIFSDMLGCGESDRVTIYLKSGNNFVVLGRYAKRPQLAERSRPMYPLDEGLIAEAWRNGWAFEPCLPHPGNEDYGREAERRWKIPQAVTDKMRMRARCLGGTVVADMARNRLAVLIFESTKCKRWAEADLRRFAEGAARAVVQILQLMKPYEPDPSTAKREGL